MCIILVGIKHCGKSTQGCLISQKLNVPFFDTDDIITELNKKTPREIWTESGNEGFQQAELKACEHLYKKLEQEKQNAVIATGGGICCNEKAIQVLKKIGTFVYLKTSEDIACGRILREIKVEQDGTMLNVPAFIAKKNPHSIQEARDIFHTFFLERQELYTKIADISIDVTNSSKTENAQKIIETVYKKS